MDERAKVSSVLGEQPTSYSQLDIQFAKTMMSLVNESDPVTYDVLCAVSEAAGLGNVCLNLSDGLPKKHVLESGASQWGFAKINEALEQSALCSDGTRPTPLVLDGNGYCYLYRYWHSQQSLVEMIIQRCNGANFDCEDTLKKVRTIAQSSNFLVLTGGPGTGKTTLVAGVLAGLLDTKGPLQIRICAPTGKAAARLKSALKHSKQHPERFDCSAQALAAVPMDVTTIHKLLRPIGGERRFRYNRENLLPLDVLVVDEASMVDIGLLVSLFEALPKDAKVILLGDKDQLSSIEPGMVFGDICYGVHHGNGVQRSPLANCIVHLKKSYRFAAASGIGRLARAVVQNETEKVFALLNDMNLPDLTWIQGTDSSALSNIVKLAAAGYCAWFELETPEQKLIAFENMRVLCATNAGPWGVSSLNERIQRAIQLQLGISWQEPFFENRPIMVTQNNYSTQVFNGDTGIVCASPKGIKSVAFPGLQDVRMVPPSLLGSHITAFANTIHKSQGSEFAHTIVVLPQNVSPLLSRELLYTAITRAKDKLTICATKTAIDFCLSHPIERTSALRDILWPPCM